MPTNHRDRIGCGPRRLRALTAVVALYALVLQALLGAIATLPVAGAPGLLCATAATGTGTAPDSGSAPGALHATCCTAAGHGPAAAPPPARADVPARTRPEATGWQGRAFPGFPTSPFRPARARAPPFA